MAAVAQDSDKLTNQQEKFCQGCASGLTQADGYRAAYPKSLNWKDKTVTEFASRLMAHSNVSARVSELKQAISNKGLWTRERSVIRLAGIADTEGGKATDTVAAIKELNLMHGFNAPVKLDIGGELTFKSIRLVAGVRP